MTQDSLRLNVLAGFLLSGILVLVLAVWAIKAELSGAVVASGSVAVKENSKAVQHLEGGIVSQINVSEGDYVEPGTVVVELDQSRINAGLAIVEGQLAELIAEDARLKAERDDSAELKALSVPIEFNNPDVLPTAMAGQKKLLASVRETLRQKKSQLRKQIGQTQSAIEGIESKLDANKKQIALAEKELDILGSLFDRGLTTRGRIVAMQREHAQLQGQTGEFKAELAQLQTASSEIELKILEIDEQRRSQVLSRLGEVRAKLASLREQWNNETARLQRTRIVSPIAGYVHDLKIHTRQGVISPGEGLMTIVPSRHRLVFRTRVRPQDIDEVYVDQNVRLRLTSYKGSTTPEFKGTVAVISADQLVDEKTGVSYYKVDIEAKLSEIEKIVGPLKPGMPVEAFITTQERTVLAYLVKPITDQFAKAFREQ